MSKDTLRGALAKSMQDENAAVDERFERADSILGSKGSYLLPRYARPQHVKKVPVIRDTFSFPEFDYALLSELRAALLKNGHSISKSELVRAGLKTLAQMKPGELLKTARAVEKLKPGRAR